MIESSLKSTWRKTSSCEDEDVAECLMSDSNHFSHRLFRELSIILDSTSRYLWFCFSLLFQAVSNHESLALSFLEHVIRVLNQAPVFKATEVDKDHEQLTVPSILNPMPQSATLALGAVFR